MRELIANIIGIYTFVILIRVIVSWFPSSGGVLDVVRDVTGRITEPLLGPIRRALPAMGGLDLSPVVLLLALQVLRSILLG
jgi:YggT family protein